MRPQWAGWLDERRGAERPAARALAPARVVPASPARPPVPPSGSQPRLARRGDALYLRRPPGPVAGWWRVYWIHYGPPLAAPHKRRPLPVGHPRSNYLWFVARDGRERCVRLTPEVDRTTSAAVMAVHLARAWMPGPVPRP